MSRRERKPRTAAGRATARQAVDQKRQGWGLGLTLLRDVMLRVTGFLRIPGFPGPTDRRAKDAHVHDRRGTTRRRATKLMKSSKKTSLLKETWTNLDSFELRLLLAERIGRQGQYDRISTNTNKLYLPLARSACRIALTFRDKKITAIEPGPAFDHSEWVRISEEIEQSILAGPSKVGREYSFSTLRVTGSWRGKRSGAQILPPPDNAPRADLEIADHPFILEFPIIGACPARSAGASAA